MLCCHLHLYRLPERALSKKKKLPEEEKSSNKDERTFSWHTVSWRKDAEELVDVASPIILSG